MHRCEKLCNMEQQKRISITLIYKNLNKKIHIVIEYRLWMKCSNWNRKYVKMQKLCEKERLAFISNDVRVFTFSYTRKIKRVVWMTATFFMSRFQMYLLFRIHTCSTSFQLTDFVFETFSLLSLSHLYYQIIHVCLVVILSRRFHQKSFFLKFLLIRQYITILMEASVAIINLLK